MIWEGGRVQHRGNPQAPQWWVAGASSQWQALGSAVPTVGPPEEGGVYTAVLSVTGWGLLGSECLLAGIPGLLFAAKEKDLRRRVVDSGGWELAREIEEGHGQK